MEIKTKEIDDYEYVSTKVKKNVKVFVSCDGQEFFNDTECIRHENNFKRQKIEKFFYDKITLYKFKSKEEQDLVFNLLDTTKKYYSTTFRFNDERQDAIVNINNFLSSDSFPKLIGYESYQTNNSSDEEYFTGDYLVNKFTNCLNDLYSFIEGSYNA